MSDAQFGKEVLKCGYKAIRISVDGNRYNYYTIPNFNGNNLKNKYYDYIHEKSNFTESSEDKNVINGFIKAFADYFINHSINDEEYNKESVITQIDKGNLNIEDIVDITDKVLKDKEPK